MRTPKGYTTKTLIQNYLLITIDSTFDTQVNDWIAKVEDYIDRYTHRNFIADTTASARLYDGDGTEDLLIDDCVDVTKVEQGLDTYGGTFQEVGETGSDRYFTYPANSTALLVPITKIVLSARAFPCGNQNNRITGKWGYSVAVPAEIEHIATVLAAGIINFSLNADGEVQSMTVGQYTVAYKDKKQQSDLESVEDVLKMYKRYEL